ncbi:MAG: hypothetical protein O3C40_13085 [Planctomycetota bacterium]|nr:hypothetical protein [Planctomycetota bacterium]
MERLHVEFEAAGKTQLFEELKGFIIGDHAGTTYDDVARRLNMTEGAAKMAASRMRRRYRELLREEIAQTVNGPEEVDEEIRDLFTTLGA